MRNAWVETEFYEGGKRRTGPSFGPKTVDGEVTLRIQVRRNGQPSNIGSLVIGPLMRDENEIGATFYPFDARKAEKVLYRGKR